MLTIDSTLAATGLANKRMTPTSHSERGTAETAPFQRERLEFSFHFDKVYEGGSHFSERAATPGKVYEEVDD